MWYRKKRIYAVLLIIVLVGLFSEKIWLGQLMYPIHYEEAIRENALKRDIDPYLLTAIIRVESNFSPDKQSKKGAAGLMQLMPSTAQWIVTEAGYGRSTLDRLHEPEVNIEIGSWFIRSLQNQFVEAGAAKEREIAIIAASYNAGPGNVAKWLQTGRWDGNMSTVDQIPFGETRHYVHRVHYYYKKYSQIYPELGSPTPRAK
ncbi:lytic transglycosylase domain-containing protein [Paenibacillus thermotolerans]|uniref:lytic transglycosylase domain-containing protein n=1 Tax=Paenibacillus thermotolerans TaxID=3027807 RepID=UPI0023687697|nr:MULTISPECIES: lytic transglycosylase domain-containing protein [unclassified Paenibacillus]